MIPSWTNSWWTPEVFAHKVSLNLYNSHLKLILSICMWTCGQRSPETFNNKSGWVSHPVCDNVSQNSVPGLRAESTVFYTVLFQRTKKRSKGPFCSISWKILDRFWLIQWNLSILIQKFTKNLLETVMYWHHPRGQISALPLSWKVCKISQLVFEIRPWSWL